MTKGCYISCAVVVGFIVYSIFLSIWSAKLLESSCFQTPLPVQFFRWVSSLWRELEASSDLSKENVERYLMCKTYFTYRKTANEGLSIYKWHTLHFSTWETGRWISRDSRSTLTKKGKKKTAFSQTKKFLIQKGDGRIEISKTFITELIQ